MSLVSCCGFFLLHPPLSTSSFLCPIHLFLFFLVIFVLFSLLVSSAFRLFLSRISFLPPSI